MFVPQNVRRQNIHSAKCLLAKCLSAKCPGTDQPYCTYEAPKTCESHMNTAASHVSQKSFYQIKYLRACYTACLRLIYNYKMLKTNNNACFLFAGTKTMLKIQSHVHISCNTYINIFINTISELCAQLYGSQHMAILINEIESKFSILITGLTWISFICCGLHVLTEVQ